VPAARSEPSPTSPDLPPAWNARRGDTAWEALIRRAVGNLA